MASLDVKISIIDGPSSEDMYTSMRMRDLRRPHTVTMETKPHGRFELRILSMEVDTVHEHGSNAWRFTGQELLGPRKAVIAGYFSTSTRKGMITHVHING